MAALVRNTLTVFILALSAKSLGFLRDIIFVNKFGAGLSTDTLYAALNIVDFMILFSGLETLQSVATTILTRKEVRDDDVSGMYTSLLIVIASLGGTISLCTFAFARPLCALMLPGFSAEVAGAMSGYLRVMAAMVLFKAAFQVFCSIFGIRGMFFSQNIFQLLINICVVVTILASAASSVVFNLSVAFSILYVVFSMAQFALLHRAHYVLQSRSIGHILHDGRSIARLSMPLLWVSIAYSLSGIVDKAVASHFGQGLITALNITFNLCFISIHIVLVPLSNVLFPRFSRAYFSNRLLDMQTDFRRGLNFVMLVFIPAALFLVFFSRSTIAGIAFSKNMPAETIEQMVNITRIYGATLLFRALYFLPVFALQAAQLNVIVGITGCAVFLFNVGCCLVFSRLLGYIGIPWASAATFTLYSVVVLLQVRRHLGIVFARDMLAKAAKALVCALGASALALITPSITAAWDIGRARGPAMLVEVAIVFCAFYCILIALMNGKAVVALVRDLFART